MKPIGVFLACSMITLFAGCASNRGGSVDQYDTTTSTEPTSSPSFRPGMHPEDPRDAQFGNRPEPGQPTKP